MALAIVSGFRNAIQKSRFADRVSATIGTADAAVGMHDGGYYQSAKEHQGRCNDE
jgi:uncharacterized protein with FMN-binding domain